MGECNYYLKARFPNATAAADAVVRVSALLAEGHGAYQYWQDSRPWNGSRVPPNEFWTGFRVRFPLTVAYLRELANIPDWDNGLSGHLGCLVDPRQDQPHPSALLTQDGDLLLLQLNLIWHGTDLGLLERYCGEELGAVGVGSISEEELDDDEDSDLEEMIEQIRNPFEAIWV